MRIPILNGIYTDENADFRISYPQNLMPVFLQQGISNGYLRPVDGIISTPQTHSGKSRGAINWNNEHYRVMGTKLVKISESGSILEIGDIGGTSDNVTLDYSFDRLGIASNKKLYYWDNSNLNQVTDSDLGDVLDFIWVDGYFMTTDGEYIVVTELNDPYSVFTTKYGSSEVDPDPVKALLKLRNEPYVLNRYTIETFDNVGGSGFPFDRIEGAQIPRGVIGTHACCIYMENIAFVGSGRNEGVGVWLGSAANSVKVSTQEIDTILAEYNETTLSTISIEAKTDQGFQHLYIHLPDKTIVYDGVFSQQAGEHIWFILSSGIDPVRYRARHLVFCHNKWWVGDTQNDKVGYLSQEVSTHWGEKVGWGFSTVIVYNEGFSAIFHEIELVCLSGRVALNIDPTILTQYSLDGETWSVSKHIKAGKQGTRNKRIVWLHQGPIKHWRIQRFKGTSDVRLSIARLEVRLEKLLV